MPRPPRADEACGLDHALNRGHSRARIFRQDADYEVFQRIIGEVLARYDVQLLCFDPCKTTATFSRSAGTSSETPCEPGW
jgi:hypothetical protein